MPTIKVNGMSCGHCKASVEKALSEVQGLTDINVDLDKGEASFTGETDLSVVKEAVKAVGFEAP